MITLYKIRHARLRMDIRVNSTIATVFDTVMIINQLGTRVYKHACEKRKMLTPKAPYETAASGARKIYVLKLTSGA
jgi:hypothetical protein